MMEATPVLTVLRRRGFALLWSGQLISNVGNWMFWIALPFYVYERTGSVLAVGIMLIVKCGPPYADTRPRSFRTPSFTGGRRNTSSRATIAPYRIGTRRSTFTAQKKCSAASNPAA